MSEKIRVTVWNEFRHEKSDEAVRKIYPEGMHAVIANALAADKGIKVRTASLDEPEHGLTDEELRSVLGGNFRRVLSSVLS